MRIVMRVINGDPTPPSSGVEVPRSALTTRDRRENPRTAVEKALDVSVRRRINYYEFR
jgi:hypothetical protein